MSLLELRDISKRFGGLQALARVSLKLEEGMIASLIGPNGAGRTTLFNTLTGIYRPDAGEIRFQNRPLVGLKPEKITSAGISRTFQNIRLFSHMTVLENVLVGMHSRTRTSLSDILLGTRKFHAREQAAKRKAMELIELTGLTGREGEWAHRLSYGEQRRLEIARALGAEPKLLLLDEPSMGLAPKIVEQIFNNIQAINRAGVTVLLVEQNAAMALAISHRGYVLETGNVILEGKSSELTGNDRVRQAYLGG